MTDIELKRLLKLEPRWHKGRGEWLVTPSYSPQPFACGESLNRAISECAAQLQALKQEEDKRFGQPHFGHSNVQL